MNHKSSKLPLVVIVGQTATGKSRLAFELAKRIDGEIICADSWTVRREVNIGADKPSLRDRKTIPHYLVDIVGPCDDFTAAVFKTMANEAIDDIYRRGHTPIMVGGSGLYIDSVLFDYGFLRPGKPGLRSSLNRLSVEELIQRIKDLGLPLHDDIDICNKRRLIRLIESGGEQPTKTGLRDNTLVIGVKLRPEDLILSIDKRVNKMLATGLEQEVKNLSDKYGWDCEALKGVGYKQWRRYFEGTQTIDETRQQIVSATNNLAKKQNTWFKRNKSIHWFLQPVNIETIVALITTKLAT